MKVWTKSESTRVKKVISERFLFVYDDAHGVGYMLDPRYNGKGMDQKTRRSVEKFIIRWHGSEHEEAALIDLSRYAHYTLEMVDFDRRAEDYTVRLLVWFKTVSIHSRDCTKGVQSCLLECCSGAQLFSAQFLKSESIETEKVFKLVYLFF